ncbi:hypothetical protein BaRGS_00015923 [Batillaria attramentaria]|uniref:Uncharacterized protein n=1 Tax=Batillaria attramentaria TaxID=370345 RepID=A0ABD0KZX5_9CAEN
MTQRGSTMAQGITDELTCVASEGKDGLSVFFGGNTPVGAIICAIRNLMGEHRYTAERDGIHGETEDARWLSGVSIYAVSGWGLFSTAEAPPVGAAV